MLILSRRPGDAILIDGGIRIVVLASGQRCVRLGIEAPAQVGIVREEIVGRSTEPIEAGPALNGSAKVDAPPPADD
jgi:carbon storage regulator CsrA